MDRPIVYPSEQVQDTDFLTGAVSAYIGLGKLASATLGVGAAYASRFPATPGSGLNVAVGDGELYFVQATDTAAYSSLPANADPILKQGIYLGGTVGPLAVPGVGLSVAYLIQVAFVEVDGGSLVLPYYNSTPPHIPFSGAGNSGLPNNTLRQDTAVVSVKAGTAAATGTQVPPSPDAGKYGLWVVTVTHGDTSISGGAIARYASSPAIDMTLDAWQSSLIAALADTGQAYNGGNTSQLQQLFSGLYLARASAGTVDLGAPVGGVWSPNSDISGTTTIASFGNSAKVGRPMYFATFSGALTITNSGTMICPGGVDLKIKAGDSILLRFQGSSTWKIIEVKRASFGAVTRGWAYCTTSAGGGGVAQQYDAGMGAFTNTRNAQGDYTLSWANALDVGFMFTSYGPIQETLADRTSTSIHLLVYDVTNGLPIDGPHFNVEFKHA